MLQNLNTTQSENQKPTNRSQKMPKKQTIGKLIYEFRKKNGVTQIEMSSKLKITQGTLSRIEKDVLVPSCEVMYGLRAHYRFNVNKALDIINKKA